MIWGKNVTFSLKEIPLRPVQILNTQLAASNKQIDSNK